MKPQTLESILARCLIIWPTACWEWTLFCLESGYGMCAWHGKDVLVHRKVYELLVGPIPDGMTIDHLCRNRKCCNPDHLEVVTMRENVLRGTGPTAEKYRQTHCIRGHLLSGDNLYITPQGRRECRECCRQKHKRQMARKREEAKLLKSLGG